MSSAGFNTHGGGPSGSGSGNNNDNNDNNDNNGANNGHNGQGSSGPSNNDGNGKCKGRARNLGDRHNHDNHRNGRNHNGHHHNGDHRNGDRRNGYHYDSRRNGYHIGSPPPNGRVPYHANPPPPNHFNKSPFPQPNPNPNYDSPSQPGRNGMPMRMRMQPTAMGSYVMPPAQGLPPGPPGPHQGYFLGPHPPGFQQGPLPPPFVQPFRDIPGPPNNAPNGNSQDYRAHSNMPNGVLPWNNLMASGPQQPAQNHVQGGRWPMNGGPAHEALHLSHGPRPNGPVPGHINPPNGDDSVVAFAASQPRYDFDNNRVHGGHGVVVNGVENGQGSGPSRRHASPSPTRVNNNGDTNQKYSNGNRNIGNGDFPSNRHNLGQGRGMRGGGSFQPRPNGGSQNRPPHNNYNNNDNDQPNGSTPASSAPMSRNTTNGSSAQHSSSQRRPVNNQIISNRNQRAQFPYTGSVEDDNNFVVPSDWIINTTEELREYWKMIIELHAKFGVFYTLDFQGHRLGDPKGTICQITIKADSINGYDDALLPINTLTKLGNSNMEYIKLHDVDPKDRLRDWLRAERLPFYMPCIISVCKLGEAAFTTEYEGLSLGRIIQEKKYNKLVFAAHRPAVNLAAQYGIRFDSDLNDNDSSNGKKTSPEENNKTSPVEKNEICTEEGNKIKLEEKKPPIPGERTWKERMRPRGLIDIQLLEAAVRRCLPQRGTHPRPSDAEPEPLVPPNTDFLSSQAYNNYRLKHLSDIVCSELAGWNSTYDGNVLLGPMGRTRSEHYDPAIQIELLDDSLWLENDTIRVSPLKFKIHSDVASLHHRDRITVFRLVSDEDKKPHTGDNMFCNVSSSSSSTPRNGCDVDLARYSVRNIIYMSHLFCVLNYKMRLRRPQVYETYITLDDVCYHTRKHINRAVRRGNGRDPSFDRTPWDAIWEYFCKARGDLGYAYTTQ